MKRTMKVLSILALFFTINACGPGAIDEDFNVDIQDPQATTDPDEPEPGCDNPNGCPAKQTRSVSNK